MNAELPAFFKKLPSRNLLTMKESLPIKIRDSVALVTGANRGLGLAFVEELLTQLARSFQKKPSFRRENYATRTETQEVHANFILQVLARVGSTPVAPPEVARLPWWNFNASPTARKYRRCGRSSILQPHYAEKAWPRKQRGIGRN